MSRSHRKPYFTDFKASKRGRQLGEKNVRHYKFNPTHAYKKIFRDYWGYRIYYPEDNTLKRK